MEKLELKNRKGLKIVGRFSRPNGAVRGTCVIEHGWSGKKEAPHIIAFQEAFLENGWQTFNFDATNSFNESEGKYEDSRLGLHYEDMEDVCQWVQKQDWFVGPLAISGHSMGGYAAARYAEDHPEEVALIAPIAPVVSGRLTNEARERDEPGMIKRWQETGWHISESIGSEEIIKRAPYAVHEEWQNHDLLLNTDRLTMPVFLLTGTEDTSCPPEHVQQLFDTIPHDNKVFKIVEGAPHTYRSPEDLATVKQLLSDWLRNVAY
jgi:pimeloyl-ACP methyl ester carboxylesterase